MYHDINDVCKKIDVIKEKAERLQLMKTTHPATANTPEFKFELDDIRAMCAEIANDRG